MNNSEMKKALVTGGSGFVGSHLVERLSTLGFDIHVATRRDAPGRNVHVLDITDPPAVQALVRELRPQHVFHLAASNIMSGVTASAEDVVNVNVLGTLNLLRAAKDVTVESFVMTGSFLEYGAKDHPVRESDLCEPAELYAVSKLSATLLARSFGRTERLPVIVFRLFTPYGPRVQKGRLVHEVIKNALASEPILLTHRDNARDFVHVDDVCTLLVEGSERAKEYAGEIFNLGSGRKTRLEDLVALVLKAADSSSVPRWEALPSLAYDADSWQADMTKTFAAFAWRPRVAIADGVAETVATFRNRGRAG
jgi:nucleoside-diphosphate-sugar epimerase